MINAIESEDITFNLMMFLLLVGKSEIIGELRNKKIIVNYE